MMRLIYVESDVNYSTYLDELGKQVYLAHGPGLRRLVDFDQIYLVQSWTDYPSRFNRPSRYNRDGWLAMLRSSITEPEIVDEIRWCADCDEPVMSEDAYFTQHEDTVCEGCRDNNYSFCNDCDELASETSTTLDDREICGCCRDNNYSFCNDCNGYYHDEDSSEHDHEDGGGCCESPAQGFTVRNDGEKPLANDERVTITLPAGVVDDVGMNEIRHYLQEVSYGLDEPTARDQMRLVAYGLVDEIGANWQTRQGNFTKRLSRYAYTKHELKISPKVLSQVGCIARDHSTAVNFDIEVTRNLNLSADDFANDGSCWWNSYSESRCALKTNGGYGLRSFGDGGYVSGRAWVLPLTKTDAGLSPTFDTYADAFVVFNGYGDLSGYVPARIVAHMTGLTYRKIRFSCTPMYVNNDSGYLIAPEEIAAPYTDGSLHLSVNQHANLFEKELANVA